MLPRPVFRWIRPFELCRAACAAAVLLSSSCGAGAEGEPTKDEPVTASTGAPVDKGHLQRWPETTMHLSVAISSGVASATLVPKRPAGISAFWSIASTKGSGTAFFYALPSADGGTRVAHAAARRIQDVSDASTLDYSQRAVGPIAPGDVVVVHHPASGRYLALVLDAIEPADLRTVKAAPYAYADVTWYLAAAGRADFSTAP